MRQDIARCTKIYKTPDIVIAVSSIEFKVSLLQFYVREVGNHMAMDKILPVCSEKASKWSASVDMWCSEARDQIQKTDDIGQ